MSFCHYHQTLHKDIELLDAAQKKDIERFLATSETLSRVRCRAFDPVRCRLPSPALHLDCYLCRFNVYEDVDVLIFRLRALERVSLVVLREALEQD